METDKKSRVVKGGLEFIPLKGGEKESDYIIPRGLKDPRQGSLFEGCCRTFSEYRREQMGDAQGE